MAYIKIKLDAALMDGHNVTFKAPCDCTAIEGLKVCYIENNSLKEKIFSMKDTHGNALAGLGNLFAEGAYVHAILDSVNLIAYLQNAATNGYLEGKLKAAETAIAADHAAIEELVNNQIPEEYLQACVDDYINENGSGLATKEEVTALDAKLSGEIESNANQLSSEIVNVDDKFDKEYKERSYNNWDNLTLGDSGGTFWASEKVYKAGFIKSVRVKNTKEYENARIIICDASNVSIVYFDTYYNATNGIDTIEINKNIVSDFYVVTKSPIAMGRPANFTYKTGMYANPISFNNEVQIAVEVVRNSVFETINKSVSPLNGAFAIKDYTKNRIVVDCLGNGNFINIKGACLSIKDSSISNQYEIVVLPGTYNEVDIVVPDYVHIHGLHPNTVFVHSNGYEGTKPVFDQKGGNSKLSNMHIKSFTGYCIHYDDNLAGCVVANDNLMLEKSTFGSIIGGGTYENGVLFKWTNCTFINGVACCHTGSNRDFENARVIFDNCKFVNANVNILNVGGFGNNVFEFNNTWSAPFSRTITVLNESRRVSERADSYYANTNEWQIVGHNNENLTITSHSDGEGLMFESANVNQNISISGNAVDCLFGYTKQRQGNSKLKGRIYGGYRVQDQKAGLGYEQYNTPIDVYQMWKRLGDCSANPKVLNVTVGGTTQTYTFNQNYLVSQTSEAELINDVNSVITIATLKKYIPTCWENITTQEKTFVIAGTEGLIEGQFIKYDGSVCAENENAENVWGIVLEDGANGELVQVWVGKSIKSSLSDGLYGVGADGKANISATTKIGRAYAGVFVRE